MALTCSQPDDRLVCAVEKDCDRIAVADDRADQLERGVLDFGRGWGDDRDRLDARTGYGAGRRTA